MHKVNNKLAKDGLKKMRKGIILKGCGGMSDVQICLHAPKANMQTYLYGTAKETEQMLMKVNWPKAPQLKIRKISF